MKVSIFEENKKLKEDLSQKDRLLDEWKKKYRELHKENNELRKENKDLEKKLNQFMNSNTPSSKVPPYLKQYSVTRNERGGKRGKPKGAKGGCRQAPKEHDEKVIASASECPKCSSHRIEEQDRYSFTVYDMPKVELLTRKATVLVFGCKDCGCEFEGKHPLVPTKGMLGPNLQSFYSVLKHHFGGAYGKISDFTKDLFGDTFSANAINDCISNVANVLEPSYNNIREKIKTARVKQSDETGWPVNGNNWWLWVIVSMNYVFLKIDEFRSSKVLEKIFGVAESFIGVLVSDCFSAYQAFNVISQKCWLHLLRKAKFEAKKHPKKDVSILFANLNCIYNSMQEFLKEKPDKSHRIWQAILYRQKLNRLCSIKWKSESAIILVNRIRKYMHQWLVGVVMPDVPLHNNDNERPIRSLALPRKVCGGHRTEKGAKDFAIIGSHLQTWRKRNMSQFAELSKFLSESYAGMSPLI